MHRLDTTGPPVHARLDFGAWRKHASLTYGFWLAQRRALHSPDRYLFAGERAVVERSIDELEGQLALQRAGASPTRDSPLAAAILHKAELQRRVDEDAKAQQAVRALGSCCPPKQPAQLWL